MMEGEAVLLRLFDSDLDEALQLVFLSLDPESLKASRLVCKAWDAFIKRRVWGSPRARLGLRGRLLRHWKGASAQVNNLLGDKCKEVYSMACDEERVYCGTADQHIQVFVIASAKLLYQRYCASEEEVILYDGQLENEEGSRAGVQLDLGKDLLAAITLGGVVSVWQKQTVDQLFLGRPHGHVGVYGVQVWGDVVITGAADASLVLLSNMQGTWTVTQKVTTGTSYITHLDSDGDMLAVGTHTGVQLWKVEKRMNTEGDVETRLSHTGGLLEERGAKLVVWMLVVSRPYVVVVGGEEWGGVQVWSLKTGELVRRLDQDIHYHNVQLNRYGLITITEIKDFAWDQLYQPEDERGDEEQVAVVVMSLSDLGNNKVKDADLWRRKRLVNQPKFEGEVNAVSNATHMIVSRGSGGGQLEVQNFWGSPIPKMTKLRPRRKQPKEEVTRCSTSRGANILEGMVLKKKSDHSLAPNKKLRIQ